MNHQQTHIPHSLGIAAILLGSAALVHCGSDASSTSNNVDPSAPSVAESESPHPPPPPRPPRPQTKEACDACGGLWAVHGIEQRESCICHTSDSGKQCQDGRECEGQCLVNEETGFQVTDPSSPPRGFFTGNCSYYDTTFGCNWIIPPGVDELLPLPADEAAVNLCID
jgi:hypothetical protein